MPVDVATLRRWSARASTLDERLSGKWEAIGPAADARRRLDAWRDVATKGEDEWFGRILAPAIEGGRDLLPLLGEVRLPDTEPLPGWAEQLPDLLRILLAGDAEPWADGLPADGPFVDLFRPLGRALYARVIQTGDPARWSETAGLALAGGLLRRLVPPFASILFTWFECFREVVGVRPRDADGTGNTIYKRYLEWLQSGHLIRILDKWPVLARFLSMTVTQWERFALEIVERLDADLPMLVGYLLQGRDPGPVCSVETNISDPHDGGRCVAILQFASGQRLVYKPRSLAVDRAWEGVLAWMRQSGAPLDLQSAQVWCGCDYGWMAYLDSAPCRDEAEARIFFRRSGALLGLFHVLGSSDFHQENVIAVGGHPVAIDLETLLGPDVSHEGETDGHPAVIEAGRWIARSVLGSGLLPRWNEFRGKSWVGGGLSQTEAAGETTVAFLSVNTDEMRRGPMPLPEPTYGHLPSLDGVRLRPADYALEIQSGFEDTCRFLLAHRHAFVEAALPPLRDVAIRLVCRATRLYFLLMERALEPTALRDGLDWSLEFELLWRLHDSIDDATRAQVEGERSALSRFDIPLFRMFADATLVTEAGGGSFDLTQPNKRASSPYNRALSRLTALDEQHIQRQSGYIRLALDSNGGRDWVASPWPERVHGGWSSDVAVRRAIAIGERILARAIVVEDGAHWLGVSTIGLEERLQLTTAGYDLYDGAGGIAVFLAALYRITRRDDFREYCVRALIPFRHTLAEEHRARSVARTLHIGGGAGLGSVVFSLVLCAALAERPDVLADARRAASLCTGSLISSDTVFEVIGGAAGAILGLLALHATAADPLALEAAVACGRHLVERHRPESCDEPPLAGFSHGAAGIAYALQGLADTCGERAFAAAAAGWRAYERTLFYPDAGNWLDLRYQTKENAPLEYFVCSWCHGAAGIGLARLGFQRSGWDAETAREIQNAVASAIAWPMSVRDNVCCGNFGRLELLLHAGRQLDQPALIDLARDRAAARLAATSDGFQWPIGTDDENLGFFQGLSGIGYELLRFAHPDAIPSVLLWEAPSSRTAG